MEPEKASTALVRLPPEGLEDAIGQAAALWADATTLASSSRRAELLRLKQKAVSEFFTFSGKHPADVTPDDIKEWQRSLEGRLEPATVYLRLSLLSSFYSWVLGHETRGRSQEGNPVRRARPKAPKPYQSEAASALSDEQMTALLKVVEEKALSGSIIGKRDYALLLFFLLTGLRREEVISLRGKDVKLTDEGLILQTRLKGGFYRSREVVEPLLAEALRDYLTEAQRLHVLRSERPLWTRHDRAGKPGAPLTSRAYVKNLKRYAAEAGLESFHLHQTRHTFARVVAEETGSIIETQDALGHRNVATTRVYVERIGVQKDKHSRRIAARFTGQRGAGKAEGGDAAK